MIKNKHRPGISLVETLIVTATLGVIAGFLAASLEPALRSARAAHCQSHLRQLGMAYRMYLADYEQYPRPSALVSSRYLHDRQILFCPEDTVSSLLGTASSYRFRYEVPPEFRPLPELGEVDANTVLAACVHHLGQPDPLLASGRRSSRRSCHPYHLVLRADGRAERVHIRSVGKFLLPGDRFAFMDAYPGEPGYAASRG